MKELIKRALGKFGYTIQRAQSEEDRLKKSLKANLMINCLGRIKGLNINPQIILDVGAASGNWTKSVMQFWPNSQYRLIEPLEEQVSHLQKLTLLHSNISYFTGVAGAQNGTIHFSVSADLDGSGVYGKDAANVRELPVLTIDSITEGQSGPFLIKLDTHGFEVPILEGAKETLKNTESLIIEVYGFYVSPTALLFHQLSAWLEERGFRLYDIVDVMRREKDHAFWQADAVYIRADHPIFQDNNYR